MLYPSPINFLKKNKIQKPKDRSNLYFRYKIIFIPALPSLGLCLSCLRLLHLVNAKWELNTAPLCGMSFLSCDRRGLPVCPQHFTHLLLELLASPFSTSYLFSSHLMWLPLDLFLFTMHCACRQ